MLQAPEREETQSKELDDLITAILGKEDKSEDKDSDEKDAGVDETKTDEEDVTQPAEEEEEEEEVEEEEEEDSLDKEDKEKSDLLSTVEELRRKIADIEEANKKQDLTEKTEEAEQESPLAALKLVSDDDEFAEIVSNKDKFNSFLKDVIFTVYEAAVSRVPIIAANVIDNRASIQSAAAAYISNNKGIFIDNIPSGSDPDEIKRTRWDFWNKRINEIRSNNPKLSIEDVMVKAGDDLRKIIGKPMSSSERRDYKDAKKKRTPFAKAGGSVNRKVPEGKGGQEDEINRLLDAMGQQ